MAFRKMRNTVEHDEPAETEVEGEPDPRICSIWPPSGHIFMVTQPSLVGMRPRGRRTEGSNMAFRKTRDTAEHDQPAETEVEAEIR